MNIKTPLIPLLPNSNICGKCEFSTFGGTIGYRLVSYFEKELQMISPDTTLVTTVTPITGTSHVSLFRKYAEDNRVICVVSSDINDYEIRILKAHDCEIIRSRPLKETAVAQEILSNLNCSTMFWDLYAIDEIPFEVVFDEMDVVVVADRLSFNVAKKLQVETKNLKICVVPSDHLEVDESRISSGELISIPVEKRDACLMTLKLIKDGFHTGLIGSMAACAGLKLMEENKDQKIVVFLSDSDRSYTNTILNPEWMLSNGYSKSKKRNHDKWRGAAVGDLLNTSPVCCSPDTLAEDALRQMNDHDFDYLPVINAKKRLVGLVERHKIVQLDEKSKHTTVVKNMRQFDNKKKYVPITPDTELADLEVFFNTSDIAFVTDDNNWCLGVITPIDLYRFASLRGL